MVRACRPTDGASFSVATMWPRVTTRLPRRHNGRSRQNILQIICNRTVGDVVCAPIVGVGSEHICRELILSSSVRRELCTSCRYLAAQLFAFNHSIADANEGHMRPGRWGMQLCDAGNRKT